MAVEASKWNAVAEYGAYRTCAMRLEGGNPGVACFKQGCWRILGKGGMDKEAT